MPDKQHVFRYTPRHFWTVRAANGNSTSSSQSRTFGPFTNSVSFGANIPGWRERLKQGISATTSLLAKHVRVENPGYFSAHAIDSAATGAFTKSVDMYGFFNNPSSFPSSLTFLDSQKVIKADNAAKLAFVRAAKKVNRQFQGGVFLGELTEAIRMVKRPASALREGVGDYLSALKKRRPIRTPRPLSNRIPSLTSREERFRRVLSDTWIEYSFGWSPLLGDIDKGMRAIAEHRVSPTRPMHVFCIGKGHHEEYVERAGNDIGADLMTFHTTEVDERTLDIKYYGGVRAYNPSDVPFRHYGVNLREFIPTVWELVPWSFLVDYFANIGDILECATLIRSDVGWCNFGQKSSLKRSIRGFKFDNFGVKTISGYISGGNAVFSYSEVNRLSMGNGSLVPALEARLPLTGRKIANMAALLPSLKALTPYR